MQKMAKKFCPHMGMGALFGSQLSPYISVHILLIIYESLYISPENLTPLTILIF